MSSGDPFRGTWTFNPSKSTTSFPGLARGSNTSNPTLVRGMPVTVSLSPAGRSLTILRSLYSSGHEFATGTLAFDKF